MLPLRGVAVAHGRSPAKALFETEDGAAVGWNLDMESGGHRNVLVAEEIVDGVRLVR
jgi:hypothetical protein